MHRQVYEVPFSHVAVETDVILGYMAYCSKNGAKCVVTYGDTWENKRCSM